MKPFLQIHSKFKSKINAINLRCRWQKIWEHASNKKRWFCEVYNSRTIECVTLRIAEKGAHNQRFNSIEHCIMFSQHSSFNNIPTVWYNLYIYFPPQQCNTHIIRSRFSPVFCRRGKNTLIYYTVSYANRELVSRMRFVIHASRIRIKYIFTLLYFCKESQIYFNISKTNEL